jgi:hypothetical protein
MWVCQITFCSKPFFSGLRFFNEFEYFIFGNQNFKSLLENLCSGLSSYIAQQLIMGPGLRQNILPDFYICCWVLTVFDLLILIPWKPLSSHQVSLFVMIIIYTYIYVYCDCDFIIVHIHWINLLILINFTGLCSLYNS